LPDAASQPDKRAGLAGLVENAGAELGAANAAREAGLAACRQVIRSAGSAIRAVHRRDADRVTVQLSQCEVALRQAQRAVRPFPRVAYAGFLHDAEKEYAEAVLTAALVAGTALPGHLELKVEAPAWLNGLAEAASELRRNLLDRLREGKASVAEDLLLAMDDVYELLVSVDYPDAITGGLRRTADSLRAVLERTRSDLTTTLLQFRLQAALEGRPGDDTDLGAALR
jgi:translin